MEIIDQINLTIFDKVLLWGCPVAAILGSIAHLLILEVKLDRKPETYRKGELMVRIRSNIEVLYFFKWALSKLIVGGILGLVVAFYFIGIVKDDINAVTRLLAFTILIGYAAPNMWYYQESMIKRYIDHYLSDQSKKSKIDEQN